MPYFPLSALRCAGFLERHKNPIRVGGIELKGLRKLTLLQKLNLQNDTYPIMPWRLRQVLQPAALSSGLFALRRGLLNPRTLRWLRMGWGNEGWSANTSYLEAVCHWASRVRGPILECGSGLTTLLLGILAPDRVTTLEHLPEWKGHVQEAATKHSIPSNVFSAPLVDYGGFHWYSLPESFPGNFELVICDGPPSGVVVGGRYGLLPAANRLLSRNAVILLDDVERSDEQATIKRWKGEFGIHCEKYRTPRGTYAEVRLNKCVKSG
jgi:hypothetical protein